MGLIIKIHDGKDNTDYYMEWSTIFDAPLTNGTSLDVFKDYWEKRYGWQDVESLNERLVRVEKKGTSSHLDKSLEDTLLCNRAGENEKELTKDEILEKFCRNREESCLL